MQLERLTTGSRITVGKHAARPVVCITVESTNGLVVTHEFTRRQARDVAKSILDAADDVDREVRRL